MIKAVTVMGSIGWMLAVVHAGLGYHCGIHNQVLTN